MNLYLYHYSTSLYNTLKTKATSGVLERREVLLERKRANKSIEKLAYCDHISFFFEPIPSKLLSELFTEHPFWFKGNKIYEYIIEIKSLKNKIDYHVVESENKTLLYDNFVFENNWIEDDVILLDKYIQLENKMLYEWKEKGDSLKELMIQAKKHQGIIELAYKKAVNRYDFEENKNKYAANVPHIMLYPLNGEIIPLRIKELIIGSDKRKNIKD